MKILLVAAEAYPFAKRGGLGDVIGSLPLALKDKGVDVRVVIPKYLDIPSNYRSKMEKLRSINVKVGWRNQYCGIEKLEYKGVRFYFIDNEYYFYRDNLYGYYDEAERFAFFNRATLEILPIIDFKPDVIHCHDWHTGMVSVLLDSQYREKEFYKDIKTLYTIHNLKYQGVFSREILGDLLDLSESYFTEKKLKFYDAVSFMKGGIVYSDVITTVSKTYANEIQTKYFGEQLHGLLKEKRNDLRGILNGIDIDKYNPRTDKYIEQYNARNFKIKLKNKTALQEELGLEINKNVPLISIISRLVLQKGIDLILAVLDEIMSLGVQLVVLGTGDRKYEYLFQEAGERYRGRISTNIMFDEELAHKIYAASDIFLMPSLFEPCGLGQMIALRYGSLPIVRETGGLKDTITSYNEFTGEGNGFTFSDYNAHDMLFTINRAVGLYKNKKTWNKIVQNAMRCDNSWENSASEYINLYEKLMLGD
ncbi:glycogen synthase GlgA [bacterium AH-315-K05]|nr:glycogen synthase GlgA [bacterium AH-315-L21]MBN4056561.1 glycogen synthase GlgA [bacterium AH-315-K05]MBN4069646.1 glycogen synthase GlgA [bacterium AH-315-G05]MBN4074304.1 glycogen synthase GlgA [bacterium AH-315-E09]